MTQEPPDDFSKAPYTIPELRALREEDSALWSPRDMLVSLLRDIDNGKIDPEKMLMIWGEPAGLVYRAAGINTRWESLGILSHMQWLLHKTTV